MFICYYSLKLLRVYESKNHSFFDITSCLSTCQLLKKIRLIKNLFTLEYNNATKVSWESWNVDNVHKFLQKPRFTGWVNRRLVSGG